MLLLKFKSTFYFIVLITLVLRLFYDLNMERYKIKKCNVICIKVYLFSDKVSFGDI